MGCHTWFYKKIKGPTKQEAAVYVEAQLKKEIEFYDRLINDRGSFDEELLETYHEWTPEYGESRKSDMNVLISKIQSGFFTEDWIFEMYLASKMSVSRYVPKRGWFISSDELPHDLFRIHNYPEDTLHSLSETLAFIKEHGCTTYEWTDKKLKEFWVKHPDGMIDFG